MKKNVIIPAVMLAVVVIVAASCSPGRDFRRYPDYPTRNERVVVIQPNHFPVTGRRVYSTRDRDYNYRYDQRRHDNRRYQSNKYYKKKHNNGHNRDRDNDRD
jgi:hypothetical protein